MLHTHGKMFLTSKCNQSKDFPLSANRPIGGIFLLFVNFCFNLELYNKKLRTVYTGSPNGAPFCHAAERGFYFSILISRVLIIQYDPEWIVITPVPKRASVRLPHREAQMFCRSGPGATKRPCLFLVRKTREHADACTFFLPPYG